MKLIYDYANEDCFCAWCGYPYDRDEKVYWDNDGNCFCGRLEAQLYHPLITVE